MRATATGRIVNLTSVAHHGAVKGMRWEDLNAQRRYSTFGAYAQSKLANILFTRALAARLGGTGVTANAVHPGPVRSGFGMDGDLRGIVRMGNELVRPFEISPQAGAITSIQVATAPELERASGGYYARGELGGCPGMLAPGPTPIGCGGSASRWSTEWVSQFPEPPRKAEQEEQEEQEVTAPRDDLESTPAGPETVTLRRQVMSRRPG